MSEKCDVCDCELYIVVYSATGELVVRAVEQRDWVCAESSASSYCVECSPSSPVTSLTGTEGLSAFA